MEIKRSSGILIHITSLPSPFGIGDIGPEAYKFVDFLKASGHNYWQILPLNPTDEEYSNSPYSSHSAFAGNTLLISPQLLEKDDFIDLEKFPVPNDIDDREVNFQVTREYKNRLLEEAYLNYKQSKTPSEAFLDFRKKHVSWLDDFATFMALRKRFGYNWTSWPEEYRDRNKKLIEKFQEEHSEFIEKEEFFQFLFFSQWRKLVHYAHSQKVTFIGDIPFYVNHDSADCWSNSKYFKLNKEKQPEKVSGVPPDYFSKTGQLWGTPVFDWKVLKKNDYDWWIKRLEQNLFLFDIVRLDHFRAFSAYWEVPAEERTAINGKWVKTPGKDFFKAVKKKFPKMPFIAEDLGYLDEPVYQLIDKFNFPGMKVLQFAFGEDRKENPYLPFNHLPNNLVYSGTHDNNTSVGWFKNREKTEKRHLKEYAGVNVTSKNVHLILHKMALNSVAKLAIVPMQDILGLGEEAIMNTPGTTEGNWMWRITSKEIPEKRVEDLKDLNILFGRGEVEGSPEEPGDEK